MLESTGLSALLWGERGENMLPLFPHHSGQQEHTVTFPTSLDSRGKGSCCHFSHNIREGKTYIVRERGKGSISHFKREGKCISL